MIEFLNSFVIRTVIFEELTVFEELFVKKSGKFTENLAKNQGVLTDFHELTHSGEFEHY